MSLSRDEYAREVAAYRARVAQRIEAARRRVAEQPVAKLGRPRKGLNRNFAGYRALDTLAEAAAKRGHARVACGACDRPFDLPCWRARQCVRDGINPTCSTTCRETLKLRKGRR